ncbi:hypothetical protein ENBRE01_3206 [Enteropsectra breve]|nr:hypothetical protein ENBRE01_3206 [Enteropsectra breve]
MIFILTNYTKKYPFKISKRNNIVQIEASNDPIAYKATETNSPVNYLCFKKGIEGHISRDSLQPAKIFSVESIYERKEVNEMTSNYDALVNEYGDKGARDRMKKREMGQNSRAQVIRFNVENQLLPDFNRDAENIRDIYSIELLFSSAVLESFEAVDVDEIELAYYLKRFDVEPEQQKHLVALDCLYKALTVKFIRPDTLPSHCLAFYSDIQEELANNRISTLAKDRFVVKFYIILLMINDYKLKYDDIPKFEMNKPKIVSILKAIGCNVSFSGSIELARVPTETFSQNK